MRSTTLALAAAGVLLLAAVPDWADARCKTRACKVRVAHKQANARKRAVVAPYRARLLRIARCESGLRWHLNTGNGHYGGLQFTASSWRWVGGRGLPHEHSPLEQMYRAVLLMRRQGWGAWPVCSRRAG